MENTVFDLVSENYGKKYLPKDIFDAKVHLLQSLATPSRVARNTVFYHRGNGTWSELCPSENSWYFRSNDGKYSATVYWPESTVVFRLLGGR